MAKKIDKKKLGVELLVKLGGEIVYLLLAGLFIRAGWNYGISPALPAVASDITFLQAVAIKIMAGWISSSSPLTIANKKGQ